MPLAVRPTIDIPTMPKLLEFNVPLEVGTNYDKFGTLLLQDSTGSLISALEHQKQRNSEEINRTILERWLNGEGLEPKTWVTLIHVLNKSGRGELANRIELAKKDVLS